jgi:hypothetical protein
MGDSLEESAPHRMMRAPTPGGEGPTRPEVRRAERRRSFRQTQRRQYRCMHST